MFSHVTVGVSDLDRAGSFYDALLVPLGLARRPVTPDGGPPSLCWHRPGTSLPASTHISRLTDSRAHMETAA